MAEETKAKALVCKAEATSEANGERRIQFVASSNQLDRHGERVDVESLRLPLKEGGEITVAKIGDDGVEGVDIPLMLNHSFDVKDVIGSVRRAFYRDGELIFEAGFSKREIAQEILTLLEEGHLSNAFSITMSDFDYDNETNVISNAEVIEVSTVFRGANKEARLLAIKSLLGEEKMDEAEKVETPVEGVEEQADEAIVEEGEAVEKDAEPDSSDEQPSTEAEAEEDGEETAVEEAEPEKVEEPSEEITEEKESEMEKEIAKDNVVAKATPVQAVKSSDYLSSKQALVDFKNTILKYNRGSNAQIMKAWMENLKEKAISGDAILPARIEQIFFKTWVDKGEILDTFRQLGARSGAVYAMKGKTYPKAQAHEKGATKVNQVVEAIRRDLKAICIYKKLPIDLQDLFDDETGELLAFRVEELAGRVAHAIVEGAIVGGYIDQNGRGLFSMAGDLTASVGSDADDFSSAVATVVETNASDTDIAKAIKTVGAVKGSRRILVAGDGWMTDARIALIGMNYPVADIAEFVGADRIYELEEMSESGYELIAYARDAYVLAGERNATVRTDFDLTDNTDVMLVERYVAGSITGYKNVAGYPASES